MLKTLKMSLSSGWPGPAISGPVVLLMWFLTLASIFIEPGLESVAVLLVWIYIAIETPRLKPKQRKQILTLFLAGLVASAIAWTMGSDMSVEALMGAHIKLAMLLTAISFIGMATNVERNPTRKGMPSFITTLLGMHFFSSVANFSSVIVVGEQVKHSKGMDQLSQLVLSRGFGMAVLWSPFLSILPLVLEQVNGTSLTVIYPFSISLAIFGLLASILEARFRAATDLPEYAGYPLKRTTLTLPGSLIAIILLLSWVYPNVSTLALVATVAVIIPVLLLIASQGAQTAAAKVKSHIFEKLAESRAEISLFMAAGVLASGVKACIGVGLISLPFTETNAAVASLVLALIVGLSYLGLHQLALVAIFAGLLADVTTTPNLMAIAYVLGTALAMAGSTFSGLNFILKSRFHASDREILSNQVPFNILMVIAGSVIIFMMEALGIQ